MPHSGAFSSDERVTWAKRGYPPVLERICARIPLGYRDRLEFGRGWRPLLARLEERLSQIDAEYTVTGVAGRHGILHFYASCRPDLIAFTDAIWEAMREATHTCEVCAHRGHRLVIGPDRHGVLCDDHLQSLTRSEHALLATTSAPVATSAYASYNYRADPAHTRSALSSAYHKAIARTHLSASDLAGHLGYPRERVLQMFRRGELAGAPGEDLVVASRWQFDHGMRLLPGPPRVLRAIPQEWTPDEVRSFMLRPTDDLNALFPAEWLARRLPVAAVAALLISVRYEQNL